MNLPSVFFCLFFLLCSPAAAREMKAALFPLEDLSQGANSLQEQFSEHIASELGKRGLVLTPAEEVRQFMVRHRIRHQGFLSSMEMATAAEELGIDFILLGTVSQNRENPPAVGLTLSLVRARDARTLWSGSHGVTLDDEQGILGIATPKSREELVPLFTETLFADFSWQDGMTLPSGPAASAPSSQVFEVDAILIEPRTVKPGEQVTGTARLRFSPSFDALPQTYFKVGGRVYTGHMSESGRVEARWNGIESFKGAPRQTASLGEAGASVRQALGEVDEHPLQEVHLIVKFPDGARKQFYLGSYEVDGEAPAISMNLRGVEHEGGVVFRDTLTMAIHQEHRREPITRWELTVRKEGGETILRTGGEGLPDRLVWNGTDNHGVPAGAGRYHLALKAWDRAGNEAVTTREAGFFPDAPAPLIDCAVKDGRLSVALEGKDGLPAAYWRFEVWSAENELLVEREGERVPATVEFDRIGQEGDRKLRGVFLIRDILGNQQRRVVEDLLQMAAAGGKGMDADVPRAKDWVSDF